MGKIGNDKGGKKDAERGGQCTRTSPSLSIGRPESPLQNQGRLDKGNPEHSGSETRTDTLGKDGRGIHPQEI